MQIYRMKFLDLGLTHCLQQGWISTYRMQVTCWLHSSFFIGVTILQINDHCWCPWYCSTDNTAAQNAPCWSSILDGKNCFGTQEGWQWLTTEIFVCSFFASNGVHNVNILRVKVWQL